MFASDLSNRFAAAALSVVISSVFFAYAIIPGTPAFA